MSKKNNAKKTLLLIIAVLLMTYITIVISQSIYSFKTDKGDSEKQLTTAVDTYSCEGNNNLPIVIIDANGQDIETILDPSINKKTPRYEVDFLLYDVNTLGNSCTVDKSKPALEEKVQIGVRGQSSRINPKKQFSLKFLDETGEEKEVSLLNMASDSEWVLNGISTDSSLIRNHLAYRVSDEIMEFAPETRFVEVYILDDKTNEINDVSYRGVYMLMEKITRSPERVDITKADERYADTSFIIARDKIKEGEDTLDSIWSSILTDEIVKADGTIKKRSALTYVYPGQTRITDKQKEIINNYINDFELTLYSRNFTDRKTGYRKYIDVMSFVDYAIINDFFNNVDGGDVSTYFYRDLGGRLHAGPVWDFDLTLGLPLNSPYSSVEGFKMFNTTWFDQLFKDPYFVDMYITRYQFLRKHVLSETYLYELIDHAVAELGDAIQRNNAKWKSHISQTSNYEDEIVQMKEYIAKRAKWMDQNTEILYRMDESDL